MAQRIYSPTQAVSNSWGRSLYCLISKLSYRQEDGKLWCSWGPPQRPLSFAPSRRTLLSATEHTGCSRLQPAPHTRIVPAAIVKFLEKPCGAGEQKL